MMTFKRLLATVAILTMFVAPATYAQDDTPTPETTVEPTPAPELEPEAPRLAPGEVAMSIATILLGLVVAFFAGAGSITLLLTNVRNDKATLDAIEKLATSLPVEALDKILEIARTMQKAGEILEVVSDRQENIVPPAV